MIVREVSTFSAAVLAGALLLGCDSPKASADTSAPSAAATARLATNAPKDARRIEVAATHEGYVPSTVDVKKGETVVLRFKRTTKSDCLAQVVIPKLGIKEDLPLEQPVEVVVKADQEGDIEFACGMNMLKGKIHVGS